MKINKYLAVLAILAASAAQSSAVIMVSQSPSGSGSNVVFNVAGGAGDPVLGTLNGDPNIGIFFDGNESLVGSGGQATLTAQTGTFDFVKFGLSNGFTFTEAIFNIFNPTITSTVGDNDEFRLTVNGFNIAGGTFTNTYTLSPNGQNFFTVTAIPNSLITSIELDALGTLQFNEIRQVRINGAAPGTTSVPDGGTTVALLGLSLLGVAAVRRKLQVA